MRWKSRTPLLSILCGFLFLFAIAPKAWAGPCFRCKIVPVNMPVSLVVGSVQTPEFLVKYTDYKIMLEVKRRISLGKLQCMLGIRIPWERDPCAMLHLDTAIEAEWRVLDGDHIVAQGVVHGRDEKSAVSSHTLDRYLGTFVGETGKKFVLEVKFTKDGSVLNEFEPHLIVQMY